MSMLLVHELHEARDRILLLKQRLAKAREQELPTYVPFLDEQIWASRPSFGRLQMPCEAAWMRQNTSATEMNEIGWKRGTCAVAFP